jgi:uncharacterized protein (TIGR02246 family)
MTQLRLAALLSMLASSIFSAQPSSRATDEEQILKTDSAYREGLLHSDVKVLAELFADDVVIVHSDGGVDNKKNFLDAIASGRLKLRSYQRTNIRIRVYGNVALLLSQTKKAFHYKAAPAEDNDTSVITFIKRNGSWQIVAMQNTHRTAAKR